MPRYYRIHDTSRRPVESLLSPTATSRVWTGVVHRQCPECSGLGYAWDEDEQIDCPGHCHAGEIQIEEQRGTSVCCSIDSLRSYMAEAHARIDGDCVLVELEGEPMDEDDVDAAAGAVLVQATQIMSVTVAPRWA